LLSDVCVPRRQRRHREEVKQFKRQIVPPVEDRGVHPIIRFIWRKMNEDMWSQEDLATRSGVSSSAMRKWRRGERNPRISELEAVINAMGYDLVIREKRDA
jgi:ribosome-binding protein aMBF1 (putative translation factor)